MPVERFNSVAVEKWYVVILLQDQQVRGTR